MASTRRRFPPTFVDDLLARVDIVEVINERVALRPRGRNHVARCPFHEERTPSFSVSREKQLYHCFGCKVGGTAITFLMEHDGLGFVDAVEELAARVGLEVPGDEAGPGSGFGPGAGGHRGEGGGGSLAEIYALLERANRHYQHQLRAHPDRARAVDYLKSRGVTGKLALRFEIGFAPPGWEGLAAALEASGEAMERAGLAVRRDRGSFYDRFRDRVMFPIRDRRGRVVGFGGRIIGDGEPKYLNSSDGPVFHKGRELYGHHQVLRGRGRPRRLLVVEGYLDVIALAEFGIEYAVATLGTAATREHLQQLYRSADEVVFCFDGDAAGRDAAWRALEQALPLMRDGRQASFLLLPEGEDPDSYVRGRGAAAFESAVESASPLSEYLFATLLSEVNPSTVEGRARLVERSASLIATAPVGAYRILLADRAAELGRLPREEVQTLLRDPSGARSPLRGSRQAGSRGGGHRRAAGGGAESRKSPSSMRRAIHLLLHRPALAERALEFEGFLGVLEGLDLEGAPLFADLLRAATAHPRPTTAMLLERYRGSDSAPHLEWLAGEPLLIEEGLEAEFVGLLARFGDEERKRKLRRLERMSESRPLDEGEKEELRRLLAAGDVSHASRARPEPGSPASTESR